MPIKIPDVLKTGVVLAGVVLLGESGQRDKFAELVATETISEMLIPTPGAPPSIASPSTVGETGLVIDLHKDRIQLVSTPLPLRTSIERQYPSPDDLERLADVANYAIQVTDLKGQVPTAVGFNIDLVYRQTEDKASETYIGERLFSNERLGIKDWTMVGGGGKISFEGNGARWNFTVEPRANDTSHRNVYLSLNRHKDGQQVPNRDDILLVLQEVWKRSHEFASQLDTSV